MGSPPDDPPPDPIEMELGDVLDLHTFPPREVKDLVQHYLDLSWEAGFAAVRIIHGRGVGAQRRMVRTLAARDARIASFEDAPLGSGGWGATVISFRREPV